MITCDYFDLAGNRQSYDLDAVVDIVRGESSKKAGWVALIVFEPASKKFIELRDSPPDPRGNSKDEAEEVDENYVVSNFQLSESDIDAIKNDSSDWTFIDLNK
ncbi:hypothetical protein EZI54_23715 [Marinobacter halodurans]|uniref:Uncharacterized protein n=1 Tax=Marinobacter halodurans TaxID=2528979 RepID=A0ABY1ZD57_9GAMM|nr:hypothetical protein [Marinobacter halodurans]TBW44761.1 hypothetical protein EZI54_23715 [Marinobacter halodurans]